MEDYRKDLDMDKKEKFKLQFIDKAIENYNPTEDDFSYFDQETNTIKFSKQIYVPFDVSKNTFLKGLKLCVFRGTNTKIFAVQYWFNKKSDINVLGKYIPKVFTTKDCQDKLFKLFKAHTNENGLWILDPKITEREKNRAITSDQLEQLQKKTINECIIEYLKSGAPRSKQDGDIGSTTLKQVIRTAIGFNKRTKYIRVVEINNKAVIKIENKYNDRKTRKDVVISYTWDEIFRNYPPTDKEYLKANKNKLKSIYDSEIGKRYIEELNTGTIKKFIAPYNFGVQKLYTTTLKLVWYFALDKGFMGDATRENPFNNIKIKRPKDPNSFATPYTKRAFTPDELEKIYNEAVRVRTKYPFQAEALMLIQTTSIRESECLKLPKATTEQLKNGIYIIPGDCTKSGKPRQLVITSAVRIILNYLDEIYTRPGYEGLKFSPWLFPNPRIGGRKITQLISGQLTAEDLRSDNTRIRTLAGIWGSIKKNLNMSFGAIKMFRKNYATAAKDTLGTTGAAAQLTGHEQDATLDRFYYTTNNDKIIENAEKVIQANFKFATKK